MNSEHEETLGEHVYPKDLESELRRIDDLIFLSRGLPAAVIHNVGAPPDDVRNCGVRVHYFASFLVPDLTPKETGTNVCQFPKQRDGYAIWHSGVHRKVRSVFREGYGDAKLRQVWFGAAVALVRARVLRHSVWFPSFKPTTLRSLRRFAGHFGPTVFIDLNRLEKRFAMEQLTELEVDVRLTELVALTLIVEGTSEADVLRLIVTA